MARRAMTAVSSYRGLAAKPIWSPEILALRLRKKSRPLRPTNSSVISAPPCSAGKRTAALMRLVLNAPARPLSAETNISSACFSGRCASRGLAATRSSPAPAAATLAITFRSAEAYGRAAMTRSCARRSLAAETIFMALVICCVFFTERMRRRISIKLGMHGYRLLIRYKAGFEFFNGIAEFGAQTIVESFLGADLFEDGGVRALNEPVEFLFELAALFDGKIVEEALR